MRFELVARLERAGFEVVDSSRVWLCYPVVGVPQNLTEEECAWLAQGVDLI